MLTRSSIQSAVPLATLLADRGVRLVPVTDSPLSELVQSSLYHLDLQASFEGEGYEAPVVRDMDEFAEALESSAAQPDATGPDDNQHDAVMEDVVQKATAAVSYSLQLARNTVNAQIEMMVENAKRAIDSSDSEALNPLYVEQQVHDPILDSPLATEVSERYANFRTTPVALSVRIARPENVDEYLRTGSPMYDEMVQATLTRLGEDAAGLWDRLFGGKASYLNEVVTITRQDTWAVGVLVSVLVQNVQNNIPAGVNMDADEFQVYLSAIRANVGRTLSEVPAARRRENDLSRLVVRAPRGENPRGAIVVNEQVYARFLDHGGTPEVLFGAVISGEIPAMVKLLEEKDQYLMRWTRARNMLQSAELQRRFVAMHGAFRETVTVVINEMDEDALVVGRDELHARLRTAITRLTPNALNDMWNSARALLCAVVYPHTSVETILQTIDREADGMEEVDITQVALIAAVDYIAGWLAGQVEQVRE